MIELIGLFIIIVGTVIWVVIEISKASRVKRFYHMQQGYQSEQDWLSRQQSRYIQAQQQKAKPLAVAESELFRRMFYARENAKRL